MVVSPSGEVSGKSLWLRHRPGVYGLLCKEVTGSAYKERVRISMSLAYGSIIIYYNNDDTDDDDDDDDDSNVNNHNNKI